MRSQIALPGEVGGQTLLLQFCASAECDPSGFGEGQSLIGAITVTTGAGCVTSFVATFPNTSVAGPFITATATNAGNSTSEFSQCVAVVSPDPQQAIQVLLSDVAGLVAQGVLSQGHAHALSSKLRAASQHLERGKVQQAANQINQFIDQVEKLIRTGKLSPQQGQFLIGSAMGILSQIAP